MPFVTGDWVKVETLGEHFDPRLLLRYPEYIKNRKMGEHGQVIKQIPGHDGEVYLVDYREPHGEACGKKAIHYGHELLASYIIA